MTTPTPEQRAEEYVGESTSVLSTHMRALIADAIRQDRAASVAAIERARNRIDDAIDKEAKHADAHNGMYGSYIDGARWRLDVTLRMLDEEMGR